MPGKRRRGELRPPSRVTRVPSKARPPGDGDTVTISASALRAMSLIQLQELMTELGLGTDNIETEGAALTALLSNALGVA